MAFTEFCCRSGGSNLNAGTRTGNSTEPGVAADLTYASGTWVSATGVFTVAAGDPVADGVAVGDFASVYADGASVTTLVGRVTARTTTTITVSTTFKGGTTTDGTSTRTLKIGGAWQGPNGTSAFPFNIFAHAIRNASDDMPRVNLKNNQTHSVTVTLGTVGSNYIVQGYTAAYGDGGRAVIDGGTSGASYILVTVGGNALFCDLEIKNNGATGSSQLINAASGSYFIRCVIRDCRGDGVRVAATTSVRFSECELYGCNQSNTADIGAITNNGGVLDCVRCMIHDNTGSNVLGIRLGSGTGTITNCIIESNGGDGIGIRSQLATITGCDLYNNGGNGINVNPSSSFVVVEIANCNFVKNTLYGIRGTTATYAYGRLINCGFGTGTQANGSGTTTGLGSIVESGSVTYAADVTPWTDPANGDFRISLAAAKAAGRGSFTQTAASYAGTIGYPDIGAAQSTGGGGSASSRMVNVRGGADQ